MQRGGRGGAPHPQGEGRGSSEGSCLSPDQKFSWGWRRIECTKVFSGLPEEDATGEGNNSGYSFKGSDAVKASSKNRLGAPAAAGGLGSRKALSVRSAASSASMSRAGRRVSAGGETRSHPGPQDKRGVARNRPHGSPCTPRGGRRVTLGGQTPTTTFWPPECGKDGEIQEGGLNEFSLTFCTNCG